MQSFKDIRNATRARTAIFAAILAAPSLLLTGCGQADAEQQAHADRPPAPEISLEAAIIQGNDDAVRAHIIAGTPINTPNATGETPLGLAAVMGRVYAAEVLVGADAELETRNNSGTTPLFNAAFFCHPEVVRVLIDAGADTGTTDANGTPIRQVMETPWAQIEPVYESVYRAIAMPFDADRIESTRPTIAEMLR
jgi:ankyrin repeat protein